MLSSVSEAALFITPRRENPMSWCSNSGNGWACAGTIILVLDVKLSKGIMARPASQDNPKCKV